MEEFKKSLQSKESIIFNEARKEKLIKEREIKRFFKMLGKINLLIYNLQDGYTEIHYFLEHKNKYKEFLNRKAVLQIRGIRALLKIGLDMLNGDFKEINRLDKLLNDSIKNKNLIKELF